MLKNIRKVLFFCAAGEDKQGDNSRNCYQQKTGGNQKEINRATGSNC